MSPNQDYYNLRKNSPLKNNGYSILHFNGWLQLGREDDTSFKDSGWKFHISVRHEDLPRAWNIFADELFRDKKAKHKAKAAGTDLADKFSDPYEQQAGKMIVLYTDANVPPEHYQQLLQRIENRFQEAGIRRGFIVKGSRQIPGGAYTFYRNDKGQSGHYNAAANNANITAARRYNPFGKLDPYANFSIGAPESIFSRIFKTVTERIKNAHQAPVPPAQETTVPLSLQQLRELTWTNGMESRGSSLRIMSTMTKTVAEAETVAHALERMGVQTNIHGFAKGVRVHVAGEDIARLAQQGIRPQLPRASQSPARPR